MIERASAEIESKGTAESRATAILDFAQLGPEYTGRDRVFAQGRTPRILSGSPGLWDPKSKISTKKIPLTSFRVCCRLFGLTVITYRIAGADKAAGVILGADSLDFLAEHIRQDTRHPANPALPILRAALGGQCCGSK